MMTCMSDTLPVPISATDLARLRDLAKAQGVDVLTLAEQALKREAARPALDELLKPIRDAFALSGMSDDELADFLEDEKHRMRGVPYDRP